MSEAPTAKTIATETHGRYLVHAPPQGGAAPVLVGFHGYMEHAERHLAALRRIAGADDWLIVAVQGLHRFYDPKHQSVVASWMTSQDRELATSNQSLRRTSRSRGRPSWSGEARAIRGTRKPRWIWTLRFSARRAHVSTQLCSTAHTSGLSRSPLRLGDSSRRCVECRCPFTVPGPTNHLAKSPNKDRAATA